jgi:hypothetical protein
MVQKGSVMNLQIKQNENQVLAIALKNLKEKLALSNEEISEIIGVHRNTLSRSFKNNEINSHSKEGEFSLLLIRVYRSLFALNGGNLEAMKHWLRTKNHHVQGIPLEIMKTVLGMSRVVNYLDAIRGKI